MYSRIKFYLKGAG